MYRVCELADRTQPPHPLPPRAAPFRSFIPLDEVLGELCGTGPQSRAVQKRYEHLLSRIGPELFILGQAPPEDLARHGSPLLAEALTRMREGRVLRQGGYDGEYGVIRLFTPEELLRHSKVGLLFDFSPAKEDAGDARSQAPPGNAPPTGSACIEHESEPRYQDVPRQSLGTSDQSLGTRQEELRCGESEAVPLGRSWRQGALFPVGSPILEQLDPEQRVAAETVAGPVLIVAGPGTGKTRTLTHRLAHLIDDSGVAPENCLALTFSRRAAAEMTERLQRLLTDRADRVEVMTFHGFGLSLLKEYGSRLGLPQSFRVASESECAVVLACSLSISPCAAAQQLGRISQSKRRHVDDEAAEMWHDAPRRDLRRGASHNSAQDDAAFKVYERELLARGWIDFDDLIVLPLRLLESDDDLRASCRSRYRWISVERIPGYRRRAV